LWIISIHSVAFLMKLKVGISGGGDPVAQRGKDEAINPMSWYSGSQETAMSARRFLTRDVDDDGLAVRGQAAVRHHHALRQRRASGGELEERHLLVAQSAAGGSSPPGSPARSSVRTTFSMLGMRPTADQSTFPTRSVVTSTREWRR